MNKLVLVAALMMICFTSFGEVYKWTDSQGNVHFSDTPHEGAEQLKMPETQSYSSPKSKKESDANEHNEDSESQVSGESEAEVSGESESQDNFYTRVEITQPSSEGTVRNNQGNVVVAVEVEPVLLKKDNVRIVFDGQPLGKPQHSLTFQLNGINRGSHTIAVQVLSSDDNVIKTSSTITFYMHRPRVGMGSEGKAGGNPSN